MCGRDVGLQKCLPQPISKLPRPPKRSTEVNIAPSLVLTKGSCIEMPLSLLRKHEVILENMSISHAIVVVNILTSLPPKILPQTPPQATQTPKSYNRRAHCITKHLFIHFRCVSQRKCFPRSPSPLHFWLDVEVTAFAETDTVAYVL